ncbi:hypothetical protein [Parendozoicomonas haliclonae]|uniref:Uncharacterized protein n=1 Tax=Parendozoicomonas haliclonae TaxID=1960125 RepID=A0A1X7AL44_9GAMM|nr:hypothetical protein [Parendozoicomonas haliclonae]SMA48607.1 hypothetical protein EHSB41UT_02808 [Parendozoicomonas haliclonae]
MDSAQSLVAFDQTDVVASYIEVETCDSPVISQVPTDPSLSAADTFPSSSKPSPKPVSTRQCVTVDDQLNLSRLHHFVKPDEKAYLEAIANDHARWQPVFDQLVREGLESALYSDPDTCDLLYWAWRNERLTDRQFLECYHYLTLNLLMCTRYFGGAETYAESIEIQSSSHVQPGLWNLDQCSYTCELQGHFSAGFDPVKTKDEILDGRSYEHPDARKFSAATAIFIFCRDAPELMKRSGSQLRILSLSAAAAKAHGKTDPVLIMPCFGFGDFKALRDLRKQDEHPFALWHPKLRSMITPDGYWMGSCTHWHDFYHGRLLNRLPKNMRDYFLNLDEKVVSPRLGFMRRAARDVLSNDDYLFINGFNQMLRVIKRIDDPFEDTEEICDTYPWSLSFLELHQKQVNDRPFVDQDIHEPGKFAGMKIGLQEIFQAVSGQNIQKIFEANYLIYSLLEKGEHHLLQDLLKCDIQEYPDLRNCLLKGSYEGIFFSVFDAAKWYVDYWVLRKSRPEISHTIYGRLTRKSTSSNERRRFSPESRRKQFKTDAAHSEAGSSKRLLSEKKKRKHRKL